jgi:hypothetical protein
MAVVDWTHWITFYHDERRDDDDAGCRLETQQRERDEQQRFSAAALVYKIGRPTISSSEKES